MSGLLASLALIGGFLALVAVVVIAIKLAVFYLDRRDDRRLLGRQRQARSLQEEGQRSDIASEHRATLLPDN